MIKIQEDLDKLHVMIDETQKLGTKCNAHVKPFCFTCVALTTCFQFRRERYWLRTSWTLLRPMGSSVPSIRMTWLVSMRRMKR